jgi:CRISPR-associated protein Csb1
MNLSADRLVAACGDKGSDGGITIRTVLEPLAGPLAPVKPAIYAGGGFQEDMRWWGTPPERVPAILIDNVPSEANRLEAALSELRSDLGLPEVVLDLSHIPGLPPHLPRQLSGFRFPHRQADAYLRDAVDEKGQSFARTAVGRALLDATADNPGAILDWFPQALLFGYWQSHLGSKRSQAKLARSWVSEIVGYAPATEAEGRTLVLGVKGDALNLSVSEQAEFDEVDFLDTPWSLVEGSKKEKPAPGQSRKALSEIGHGQIVVGGNARSAVSFLAIEQTATVSFAGLRRIHAATAESSAAGRALLVALGLCAHVAAFGRPFTLRSGCDLRPAETTWTWHGAETDEALDALNGELADRLFKACRAAAVAAGLLTHGGWGAAPLVLQPSKALTSAISKTWPLAPVGD